KAQRVLAIEDPNSVEPILQMLAVLTAGATLVLADRPAAQPARVVGSKDSAIGFSLYFFGQQSSTNDGYRLLLDGARFADEHGFTSVWTSEHHFHEIGAAYPNAGITAAPTG